MPDGGWSQVVIFDVVFSDPDRMPTPIRFHRAIPRNGRVILAADYSDNQPASDAQGRSGRWTLIQPYTPFAQAAGLGIAQLQPDEDSWARTQSRARDADFVSLTWAAARVLHLPVAANDDARSASAGSITTTTGQFHSPVTSWHSTSRRLLLDKIVLSARRRRPACCENADQFRSPYTTGSPPDLCFPP